MQTIEEGANPAFAGKRALIVEDEPLIAMTAEGMFEDLGFSESAIASSVKDAIELATAQHFDVAILDLNLKGERSGAIADHLRARGVPFAFATGYGDAAAEETAGAPVLCKPFSQEELAEVLAKLLA